MVYIIANMLRTWSVSLHVFLLLGSFVGMVEATDYEQGELLYSLQPTLAGSQYFTIDPSTGIITNVETLDRESEVGNNNKTANV